MLTRLYVKATNAPHTKLVAVVGSVVIASLCLGVFKSPIGIARP